MKGYGVGHFDHPGTTVQVTGAFVLKIYSALINKNADIVTSVLSDPEDYLFIINKILVLINSFALLLLGMFTYRISHNLYLSILIQLSPFISSQFFYGLHIVTPENFLLFVSLCVLGILIYYLFRVDNTKSPSFLFVTVFSFVCGLGLATKITFFPVLIIPIIIIKNFKYKISFLILTLIFFIIFVSPALSNYGKFLDWVRRLVINNGRYGYGEPTIINFSIFFGNILRIFYRDMFFSFVYIITFGVLIFKNFFSATIDSGLNNHSKVNKLLFALFLVFTLQIIIVGKHYDQHYMIPAFMLSVIALILSVSLLTNNSKIYLQNFKIKNIYLVLIIMIFSLYSIQLVFYINNISRHKTEAFKIDNFIKENYTGELIIPTLGGANKESSLAFATYYSGSQTTKYRNLFSQLLSSHIFYNEWTRQLYPISEQISIKDEILKRKKIILQVGNYGSMNINEFVEAIKKSCSVKNITYKKVFSNEDGESVIEVYIE